MLHSRFEPTKNMPDDWRENSLYRAATSFNGVADIPAVFPQPSLDYLSELAYSLPRRGIFFGSSAREFVEELALGILPGCDAAAVNELRDIRRRLDDALVSNDFETACGLRDRRRELESQVAQIVPHEITRAEIVDALIRDGVEPEGGADQAQ